MPCNPVNFVFFIVHTKKRDFFSYLFHTKFIFLQPPCVFLYGTFFALSHVSHVVRLLRSIFITLQTLHEAPLSHMN